MSVHENTTSQLNVANIVISNIRNSVCPRLIVLKKAYPIGFELSNVMTPFGVDIAYGKSYIKLELTHQPEQYDLLCKIEKRLIELKHPQPFKSCLYGARGISAILDKNIEIYAKDIDGNLQNISHYGITNGDILDVIIELGNIYTHDNVCMYKYIVKKIIKITAR